MNRIVLAILVLISTVLLSYAQEDFEIGGFGLSTDIRTLESKYPKSKYWFTQTGESYERRVLPEVLNGNYYLMLSSREKQDDIHSVIFYFKENKIQEIVLTSRQTCDSFHSQIVHKLGTPQRVWEYHEELLPHKVYEWRDSKVSVNLDCRELEKGSFTIDRIVMSPPERKQP